MLAQNYIWVASNTVLIKIELGLKKGLPLRDCLAYLENCLQVGYCSVFSSSCVL